MTMDKREKVIKGLELCKQDGNYCYDKQCPYEKNFPKCVQFLLSDALELLKAQEQNDPRVLTREEVESINHDVVCEFRYGIELSTHTIESVKRWLNGVKYAYGKTWRCWTSRPTDEQQKAVKWE